MKLTKSALREIIIEEYNSLLTEAVKSKILQKIIRLSVNTNAPKVLHHLYNSYRGGTNWKIDWQNVPDSAFKKFSNPNKHCSIDLKIGVCSGYRRRRKMLM